MTLFICRLLGGFYKIVIACKKIRYLMIPNPCDIKMYLVLSFRAVMKTRLSAYHNILYNSVPGQAGL